MRKLPLTAVLTLASALISAPAAMAGMPGPSYTVELNKTQIVHLAEPAAAIVVGNPAIADISVHSSDTVFLVGRGYGETNIVVLNGAGQTVMNADVQVVNTLPNNGVRVYNGAEDRRTFNCAPYCQPAPVLGDSGGFIGGNSQGAAPINNEVATGAFSNGNATAISSGPPPGLSSQDFAPN